jgi:hypothetical protein
MRRGPRVSIACIGITATLALAATAAYAASGDESGFFGKINEERTSRGIRTLAFSESLASVARRHTTAMADQGRLFHNDNLPNEVSGWELLGENVGYGSSIEQIHSLFMESETHRDDILGTFASVGVGAEWRDGTLWVTEVFFLPARSPSRRSAPAPMATAGRTARRPVARPAEPQRQPVRPPAPAASPPASPAAPVGDLTRVMVERLLSADDPAVASVHTARRLALGTSGRPIAVLSAPLGPLMGILGFREPGP